MSSGCLCAASRVVWRKKSCRNTQRLGKQLEMKLYVCETSSCSLPRSSLEGRSAPLQVLFFTVHDRFSQQCDPSSAGSCLSSFQLPVIQAWLSSEGMSEMFKQQPWQQRGSQAGQGAWSHTACRNSTFPSSSFVKKPKTGWDSMGRRILELLQKDLSTGCCKAGSKPTYLYFLIPSQSQEGI